MIPLGIGDCCCFLIEVDSLSSTGTFSRDATRKANREGAHRVEVVNSEKLGEKFQRVELGVKTQVVY